MSLAETRLRDTATSPEGWIDRAAVALYMATSPVDSLPWDFLTPAQQDKYRRLATMAARMTDVTALRAAFERGASGLAVHESKALRDCELAHRRSLRFQAMDCIRAFEDSLMNGDEKGDQLTLRLQDEERQMYVNACHERALVEDADEMARVQARRDIERHDLPASGHDGALFGDGRR